MAGKILRPSVVTAQRRIRPDCVLLGLNKILTVLFFGVVLRDVAGANDIEVPAGALMVLPGELLRPHVRAAGMGVFFTWYYAGVALLTPVAGILRDASEAPGAPLLFATALELLAIAVLVLLRRLQRLVGLRPNIGGN